MSNVPWMPIQFQQCAKQSVPCGSSNPCVKNCSVGFIQPRWQNVTKTRPAGDSGGAHYTAVPYPRYDQATYNLTNPSSPCSTQPAGYCGYWIQGADLNGKSAQLVQDGVDDIAACTAYTPIDHNCYQQNGTVNQVLPKLFGAQWVMAQKYWHGAFGWLSNDACAQDPNIPPDQTKYLTFSVGCTWNYSSTGFNGDAGFSGNGNYSGSNTVNRLTGIVTNSLSITQKAYYGAELVVQNNNGVGFDNGEGGAGTYLSNMPPIVSDLGVTAIAPTQHNIADFYCGNQPVPGTIWSDGGAYITGIDGSGHGFEIFVPVVGDANNWSCAGNAQCYWNPSNDGVTWVLLGTTSISTTFNRTNTSCTYTINNSIVDYTYSSFDTQYLTVTATLSNTYTASQCYTDFQAALNSWNMGDYTISLFRVDEELALAPLCVYDEYGPTSPVLVWLFTIDDYSGSLVTDKNGVSPGSNGYIITWSQRPWIDPNNYIWKYPYGGYNMPTVPTDFSGGATLITPMRTGTIIAHTLAGCDRHFWFDYVEMQRTFDGTSSSWQAYTHGAFSPAPLPPTTMRWQNKMVSQYDAQATGDDGSITPQPGNYPQAWMSEASGILKGAKYVQASQVWQAVNFGRPCGADKYSIDQTTVCCIDTSSAGSFTVRTTGNATAPLATGGLTAGDYVVAEGSGIYKIISIKVTSPDANGNPQWIIAVGTIIDTLPPGFVFSQTSDGSSHIGRLRFPTAPGICGRVAITTSFSHGTLTINSTAAQPYLRIDPTTGVVKVNLYDSNMNEIASALSLTVVSQNQWTTSYGTAIPNAAYMVYQGVNWKLNSTASNYTGVYLSWTFNQRATEPGYTSPPAWYGVEGCTAVSVNQFTYNGSGCPAAIAIVPSGSPENFAIETSFTFPSTFTFDDVFGGFWQAGVFLTMPDPFWQAPFKPDCGIVAPDTMTWSEDNGSCENDITVVNEDGSTSQTSYYPHHPLVEALMSIPIGSSLPAGLSLTYDITKNTLAPPFYPHGIPIGDASGNYASIETDWGFTGLACGCINASGRFSAFYSSFMTC